MGGFVNNDITMTGLMILAKGQIGKPIKYTRIVLGDGYMPQGVLPKDMTAVVNEVVSIGISKCKAQGNGTVVVGGSFSNNTVSTGFFYRELALYAEDPDNGEVLYCYGNAGEFAEWIPPPGGATIVEKAVDIVTAIGAATNVTAVIASGLYITAEELETRLMELKSEIEGDITVTGQTKITVSESEPENWQTDEWWYKAVRVREAEDGETVRELLNAVPYDPDKLHHIKVEDVAETFTNAEDASIIITAI